MIKFTYKAIGDLAMKISEKIMLNRSGLEKYGPINIVALVTASLTELLPLMILTLRRFTGTF